MEKATERAIERICSRCHAVIAPEAELPKCPACGGDLVKGPRIPEAEAEALARETDHRGIVLPRRHALGGIITPQ